MKPNSEAESDFFNYHRIEPELPFFRTIIQWIITHLDKDEYNMLDEELIKELKDWIWNYPAGEILIV